MFLCENSIVTFFFLCVRFDILFVFCIYILIFRERSMSGWRNCPFIWVFSVLEFGNYERKGLLEGLGLGGVGSSLYSANLYEFLLFNYFYASVGVNSWAHCFLLLLPLTTALLGLFMFWNRNYRIRYITPKNKKKKKIEWQLKIFPLINLNYTKLNIKKGFHILTTIIKNN